MKQSNIVDGLRVRIKKSSSLSDLIGKMGTVVGVPYVGFGGTYVEVVVDGEMRCSNFNIKSLAYSNEVPEIGGRVVVRKGGGDRSYYQDGASGIVQRIDCDGDAWVAFDSGKYEVVIDNTWCVNTNQLAIIRNGGK